MEPINIVYTCDDKFLNYLAVSIDSLIDTIDPAHIHRLAIYVVSINYSDEQKQWLSDLVAKKSAAVKISFYDYALTGKFNKSGYRAIEIVTLVYYLPDFFPHLNKAIFVDADTLFVDSVEELWRLDLASHWVATTPCVLDAMSLDTYQRSTKGHFWSIEQTMNAGILILDFQKMRELGVTQVLEDWTEQHQASISLPEQEAIAFNFPTRKLIDHKWNWRGSISYSEPYLSDVPAASEYARIKPAMVHFQGPLRPGNALLNSKYFNLWVKRCQSLGLPVPERRKVPFATFLTLMTEDKGKLFKTTGIMSLIDFNIIRFPHILKCVRPYLQYRKDPLKFEFKTFEPH